MEKAFKDTDFPNKRWMHVEPYDGGALFVINGDSYAIIRLSPADVEELKEML